MAGWQELHRAVGRGWRELEPGFIAAVFAVPAHPFNGITVYGEFDPAELTRVLGRVHDSGFPYSLSTRPGVRHAVARVARHFGMASQAGSPLMAICEPPHVSSAAGLRIRRLEPEENVIHAEIVAEAFSAPLDLALLLTPPAALATASVSAFVGEVGAEPVATALGNVQHDAVGIYNVGTRAAHRGRGFGAALAATTAAAGFAAGAEFAFLLSTPMGYRVYERLGFRTLEQWSAWNSTG